MMDEKVWEECPGSYIRQVLKIKKRTKMCKINILTEVTHLIVMYFSAVHMTLFKKLKYCTLFQMIFSSNLILIGSKHLVLFIIGWITLIMLS